MLGRQDLGLARLSSGKLPRWRMEDGGWRMELRQEQSRMALMLSNWRMCCRSGPRWFSCYPIDFNVPDRGIHPYLRRHRASSYQRSQHARLGAHGGNVSEYTCLLGKERNDIATGVRVPPGIAAEPARQA